MCASRSSRNLSWPLSLFFLLYQLGGLSNSLARSNKTDSQTVIAADSSLSDRDCMDDNECRNFVEKARRLSEAGQYEAALVSYQSAYALHPVPSLLVNIGRTQQRSGHLAQAIATYRRFLDTTSPDTNAMLQAKVRDYLRQANTELETQRRLSTVSPRPSPEVTKEPRPPSKIQPLPMEQPRPIQKQWWLWTTIGGTTLAAAVGLGIGLAAQRPDLSDAMPVRPFTQ